MRLPVRQPVTQYARLNPLAGAVAEIRRSVLSFTGSQWGELNEPVVFIGHDGFTVETKICTTTTETVSIFSFYSDVVDEHFGLRINHSGALNKLKIYSAGYTPNEGSVVVNDGKIHTVKLEYLVSENRFSLYVDNLLDYTVVAGAGFSLADSYNVLVCARKDTNTYPIGDHMPGLCLGFSVWAGSGETKQLKIDIPLDEHNTDYQRNLAVPEGVELFNPTLPLSVGFTRISNGFRKSATSSETQYIANVVAGKKYLLSFKKISHSTGSPNFRDDSNNQYIFPLMSTLQPSGVVYTYLFTSLASGQVGFNGSAALFEVDNISLKEWTGG